MIPISTIHRFLTSMSFTILIETALLIIILKVITKHVDLSVRRITIAGIFASMATIPYVWFVFPYLYDWPRSAAALYSEPFAVIVEAILYRLFLKTNWKISLAASLICNLASYLVGPFLRAHGLWIYW